MRTQRQTKRAQGFSVIEVLVAMTVLAIGLTGITSAMITSSRLDRHFNGRAAAHAVAMDLVREMERWSFTDPRLALVNNHSGASFSSPVASGFTVTAGAPPTLDETLTPTPDHDERECGSCGRDLSVANTREPGSTYLFRRYWNVAVDPNNPNLKVIAVHVTWSRSATDRGVVSAFTSVCDRAALNQAVLGATN